MTPIFAIFREDGIPLGESIGFEKLKQKIMSVSQKDFFISGFSYNANQWGYILFRLKKEEHFSMAQELGADLELLSCQNPDVNFVMLVEDDNVEYSVIKNGVEINNISANFKIDSKEKDLLIKKLFDFRISKCACAAPSRMIIDDVIISGSNEPLTKFNIRQDYDTRIDKEINKFQTEFHKSCREMYQFLYTNKILQDISFDIEEEVLEDGRTAIFFAVDSKDLQKYETEMLNSGVSNAEFIVPYLIGKKSYPKSCFSGATMFSEPMSSLFRHRGDITEHEQRIILTDNTAEYIRANNKRIVKQELKKLDEDEYFYVIRENVSYFYDEYRAGMHILLSSKLVRDSKKKNVKIISFPCQKSYSGWANFEIAENNVIQNCLYDKKKYVILGKKNTMYEVVLKKENESFKQNMSSIEIVNFVTNGMKSYSEKKEKERQETHIKQRIKYIDERIKELEKTKRELTEKLKAGKIEQRDFTAIDF